MHSLTTHDLNLRGADQRTNQADDSHFARQRLRRLALVVLALCPLLVAGASQVVHALAYQDSDFSNFWLAARMQWTNQDPYSPTEWIAARQQLAAEWLPEDIYTYPLPLALLQAPLGLLPLDQAYIVWMAFSAVMLGVTLCLIVFLDWRPATKHYLFPLIAGLVLFRPVWVTLRNGQVSGLMLFDVRLVVICWEERRSWLGGLLLALLGLKPTLGLPLLILVTVWLVVRRHWRAVGGLVLGGGLLLLVAQIQNPRWIMALLGIGSNKLAVTIGYSPTLWGLAGTLCGHLPGCSLIGGGLAVALLVGLAIFLAYARPARQPMQMFCLYIPLALLIMPYDWAYDQVLLVIPLVYATMQFAYGGFKYLGTALVFICVDILAIMLLLAAVSTGEDTLSAAIPLAVFCLAVWAWRVSVRTSAPSLAPVNQP